MDSPSTPAPSPTADGAADATVGADEVADDLLVEDVSIDGMCGVY